MRRKSGIRRHLQMGACMHLQEEKETVYYTLKSCVETKADCDYEFFAANEIHNLNDLDPEASARICLIPKLPTIMPTTSPTSLVPSATPSISQATSPAPTTIPKVVMAMERPDTDARSNTSANSPSGVNVGLALGLFGGAVLGSLLLTAIGLKYPRRRPSQNLVAGSLELT